MNEQRVRTFREELRVGQWRYGVRGDGSRVAIGDDGDCRFGPSNPHEIALFEEVIALRERVYGIDAERLKARLFLDTPEGEAAIAEAGRHYRTEREFLDASIAVWREIDRLSEHPEGYRGLGESTELRQRERAAWIAYRDTIPSPTSLIPGEGQAGQGE